MRQGGWEWKIGTHSWLIDFPKESYNDMLGPKKKKKIERNNLTSIMNQSGSGDQKSSA